MGSKINCTPEIKEQLVSCGLLSKWDDGSAEAREAHDKEIRVKYDRPTEEERLELWKLKRLWVKKELQ